ncbi:hypothetical protein RHMOL_Rhmol11G0015500 [Rhododendron molle]|uniref:Uncharacterized protein n=1 Tax=Rhododendron molle TaxID=49168 RepID=A0ACC0LP83_RHOML|nr:hypothetical protein RHMOL_Rhmol11G0015500 [Rhododendron molle]
MASGLQVTGQGKAMHCSRHAKTKGGQGMTHGMPKQGVAKARLTAKPQQGLAPGPNMKKQGFFDG